MKRIVYFLFLGFIAFFSSSYSAHGGDQPQDTITFNEALVTGLSGHGGRSVIYTDQIFYQFITGSFKTPAENDSVGIGRRDSLERWEKLSADKPGVFKSRKLRGGYLYLTYNASRAETRVMEVSGHTELFVNGVPRGGDVYNKHWVIHPVELKKGENEFLIKGSRGQVEIALLPLQKPVFFTKKDMTKPDLLIDESDTKVAAIRIVNATSETLGSLRIIAEAGGVDTEMLVPDIVPMTTRKVPYNVKDVATEEGNMDVTLRLLDGKRLLDETTVNYRVATRDQRYSRTFISKIDGSVQYYAVREGDLEGSEKPAMFLSLHGAGVEARGQAASYQPKDWGHVVSPTNRREFGFDWEDWGRLDALEVQAIAEERYETDPSRTYLTGHSMGGHGTWQLGVNFPGKWAAIAPVAGWYSFFSYGGKQREENPTPMEAMFLRSSHSSNTLDMSKNYKHHGIYIHHGDSDKNVPVTQARFMREHLGGFHTDFAYYEHPGKRHWFGVDFESIFNYFKRHTIPDNDEVKTFEFRTSSPGVSATTRFVTLYQQEKPYEFCGVQVEQNIPPGEDLTSRFIRVQTENLHQFRLDLAHCAEADTIQVTVDETVFENLTAQIQGEAWFKKEDGQWRLTGNPTDTFEKNPVRYGNFKDAFRHQMLFVYSTKGSREENEWSFNKARFDAETFYYRGNSSVDIIPDKAFNPEDYPDRSVILYGNAETNAAWDLLLDDCPVQLENGKVTMDHLTLKGDQYGAYFIYPRKDSEIASVGVVGGTGLAGFKAANPNRYFVSGVGIPDLMIFTPELYKDGAEGIKVAGYFGNDWSIENGDFELIR